MANLAVDHDGREHRHLSGDVFHQIGRWLMAALMIFLGLSGPGLCYIKAVEHHAD